MKNKTPKPRVMWATREVRDSLCPDNDSNDEGTPPTRAELRAQRALAAAEDRSGMNMKTEHED